MTFVSQNKVDRGSILPKSLYEISKKIINSRFIVFKSVKTCVHSKALYEIFRLSIVSVNSKNNKMKSFKIL